MTTIDYENFDPAKDLKGGIAIVDDIGRVRIYPKGSIRLLTSCGLRVAHLPDGRETTLTDRVLDELAWFSEHPDYDTLLKYRKSGLVWARCFEHLLS